MKVSQRLWLAVLPAVLGVVLVGALAYWGAYHREAPEWVVALAGIAAAVTLGLAWHNTRYVARRIEHLLQSRGAARPALGDGGPDELDSIEAVVDQLNSAVAIATADQRHQQEVAAARVHEYAELLAETTAAVARQIDELRLPLQILLDNHFGSLNENQEEMLGAARQAADAASLELRRLEQIANLDTGALQLRRDPVRVADLLRSLLPVLKADGDGRGVEVEMDVEPGLPRVAGDRMRLQEALELWLRHTVRHADPSHAVRIVARRDDGGIAIVAEHGATSTLGPELALARRVVEAHGGTVELGGRRSSVRLPALPTPVNAPRP